MRIIGLRLGYLFAGVVNLVVRRPASQRLFCGLRSGSHMHWRNRVTLRHSRVLCLRTKSLRCRQGTIIAMRYESRRLSRGSKYLGGQGEVSPVAGGVKIEPAKAREQVRWLRDSFLNDQCSMGILSVSVSDLGRPGNCSQYAAENIGAANGSLRSHKLRQIITADLGSRWPRLYRSCFRSSALSQEL
jgi:hypothetical protein